MQELIRRKTKTEKVLCALSIALAVLWIGTLILVAHFEQKQLAALCCIAFFTDVVLFIVYLVGYLPFGRSIRYLERKGLEYIADDIELDTPTLKKSKIYCGKRGFYSKKSNLIIPYEDIAWAYVYKRKSYGITVGRSVLIYMRDGKKFSLEASADDFKWLLANYVFAASPDVITGYGAEQIKRLRALFPDAAAAMDRADRLTGIVLMTFGAVFFAAIFLFSDIDNVLPLIFTGLLFFGIGLFLFIFSRKKRN